MSFPVSPFSADPRIDINLLQPPSDYEDLKLRADINLPPFLSDSTRTYNKPADLSQTICPVTATETKSAQDESQTDVKQDSTTLKSTFTQLVSTVSLLCSIPNAKLIGNRLYTAPLQKSRPRPSSLRLPLYLRTRRRQSPRPHHKIPNS